MRSHLALASLACAVACGGDASRSASPWTPGGDDGSADATSSADGTEGGTFEVDDSGEDGATSAAPMTSPGEGDVDDGGSSGAETTGGDPSDSGGGDTTTAAGSTGDAPNSVYAGLDQDGSQVPREGLENPTLESTLGLPVEPYGDVVVVDGEEWVQGKLSWFGGPDDTGVGATETGAITGEILRELNDPLDPPADWLASHAEDYYYVAMRWSYQPNGKSWWADARLVVRNPATGAAIVVRPVDWGPNTSTERIIDLSPQSLVDLDLATDDDVQVAFALPGTPLGPVQP